MSSDEPTGINWGQVLTGLIAGTDLTRDQARQIIAEVLSGEASDAQVAALLVALAAKGEHTEEILGMREAMLQVATPLKVPEETVDIVGVGGARRRRVAAFNVSTLSSIVAAAAGATICKHGNLKASSTSGSFDLLNALGINIELQPDTVELCVRELGLGFAFARAHHPSMRHVGPARAQLGIPTVFNVLGPLAHPGQVTRQVVGVPDAARAEQIAGVVRGTDATRVWVVHGHGDLDELALSGPSTVHEIQSGEMRTFSVDPAQVGLGVAAADAVQGGDAATNAELGRAVLAGERSPNRDVIVLNAGAALVVGGVADDLEAGVQAAAAAIDDGRAHAKLADLIELTNR